MFLFSGYLMNIKSMK